MKSTRMLNGYVVVYKPDHPSAMQSKNWEGYVYEHILVAEKKLGRELRPDEVVHHLDTLKSNNTPSNLLVLEKSQHPVIHAWISSGAPISKDIGENGVNSVKATLEQTHRCANPDCGEVIELSNKYCSMNCARFSKRKVDRPDKETLETELANSSWSGLGRKYGVSDNAVRKWAKTYGLIS